MGSESSDELNFPYALSHRFSLLPMSFVTFRNQLGVLCLVAL
jgi:hypothetical protein